MGIVLSCFGLRQRRQRKEKIPIIPDTTVTRVGHYLIHEKQTEHNPRRSSTFQNPIQEEVKSSIVTEEVKSLDKFSKIGFEDQIVCIDYGTVNTRYCMWSKGGDNHNIRMEYSIMDMKTGKVGKQLFRITSALNKDVTVYFKRRDDIENGAKYLATIAEKSRMTNKFKLLVSLPSFMSKREDTKSLRHEILELCSQNGCHSVRFVSDLLAYSLNHATDENLLEIENNTVSVIPCMILTIVLGGGYFSIGRVHFSEDRITVLDYDAMKIGSTDLQLGLINDTIHHVKFPTECTSVSSFNYESFKSDFWLKLIESSEQCVSWINEEERPTIIAEEWNGTDFQFSGDQIIRQRDSIFQRIYTVIDRYLQYDDMNTVLLSGAASPLIEKYIKGKVDAKKAVLRVSFCRRF